MKKHISRRQFVFQDATLPGYQKQSKESFSSRDVPLVKELAPNDVEKVFRW